jgi:hypothetical protein
MEMTETERLEINWINAAGGALGAVSAAVVLSTLGTAGTLLGAAIGSLCITVGGAVYSHSLRVTRRRVAATRALAARRERSRSGSDTSVAAGEAGTRATEVLEREAAREPWSQVLRRLPWKRIGLLSAALFVVTVVIIMLFELSVGRPVASYTGGTDSDSGTLVPGVGGGGGGTGDQPGQEEPPDRRVEVPEEGVPEPPAQEEQPEEEPTTVEPTPFSEESPS